MQPAYQQLCHFVAIAQRDKQIIRIYPILAERTHMVAINLPMTRHAARRRPAGAHRNEIAPNVLQPDAVHKNHAKQILKIRRNAISGVEIRAIGIALKALNRTSIEAILLVSAAAAIEARMRRHKAQTHLPTPEMTAAIIAHMLSRVVLIHIMHIAIHRIYLRMLPERASHLAQNIAGRIEVVAVQDSHHIASSGSNTLIHSVVDTLISLRNDAHTPTKPRLITPTNLQRIIHAATILNNQLIIAIVLPQHTLQSVSNSPTAIISRRNYRDFHKIQII